MLREVVHRKVVACAADVLAAGNVICRLDGEIQVEPYSTRAAAEQGSLQRGASFWKQELAEPGQIAIRWTRTAAAVELERLADAGLLPREVRIALGLLGLGLFAIRPGPLVWPTTPGAGQLCLEFDLSDRAIELLAAAGTDLRHGVVADVDHGGPLHG
jgi:hypothetical protein